MFKHTQRYTHLKVNEKCFFFWKKRKYEICNVCHAFSFYIQRNQHDLGFVIMKNYEGFWKKFFLSSASIFVSFQKIIASGYSKWQENHFGAVRPVDVQAYSTVHAFKGQRKMFFFWKKRKYEIWLWNNIQAMPILEIMQNYVIMWTNGKWDQNLKISKKWFFRQILVLIVFLTKIEW